MGNRTAAYTGQAAGPGAAWGPQESGPAGDGAYRAYGDWEYGESGDCSDAEGQGMGACGGLRKRVVWEFDVPDVGAIARGAAARARAGAYWLFIGVVWGRGIKRAGLALASDAAYIGGLLWRGLRMLAGLAARGSLWAARGLMRLAAALGRLLWKGLKGAARLPVRLAAWLAARARGRRAAARAAREARSTYMGYRNPELRWYLWCNPAAGLPPAASVEAAAAAAPGIGAWAGEAGQEQEAETGIDRPAADLDYAGPGMGEWGGDAPEGGEMGNILRFPTEAELSRTYPVRGAR